MFVCCECCVLSVSGPSDELITRPEQSYKNEEAMTRVGSQRHKKMLPFIYQHGFGFETSALPGSEVSSQTKSEVGGV
jgi:hypothetical protein